MSALEQEVLEKFRLLDKAAQQRVRTLMQEIVEAEDLRIDVHVSNKDEKLSDQKYPLIHQFTARKELEVAGFTGFVSIRNLATPLQRRIIPEYPGNYLIVRLSRQEPIFSELGLYSAKNVSHQPYALKKLYDKWNKVRDSIVVYIGKAGGDGTATGLRKRLSDYLNLSSGHQGGRAIWQLTDCQELVVCWRPLVEGSPVEYEDKLLSAFKDRYFERPLANWQG